MNPFAYPPKQQAKAIAAGLASLATGGAAGDWIVAVIGAFATFYLTFAVPNSAATALPVEPEPSE